MAAFGQKRSSRATYFSLNERISSVLDFFYIVIAPDFFFVGWIGFMPHPPTETPPRRTAPTSLLLHRQSVPEAMGDLPSDSHWLGGDDPTNEMTSGPSVGRGSLW